MDRWNIVATLNYLPHEDEAEIVLAKVPSYDTEEGRKIISNMVSRRRPDARRLHQRRYLHRHVAAYGHHLGGERARFSTMWALPSGSRS